MTRAARRPGAGADPVAAGSAGGARAAAWIQAGTELHGQSSEVAARHQGTALALWAQAFGFAGDAGVPVGLVLDLVALALERGGGAAARDAPSAALATLARTTGLGDRIDAARNAADPVRALLPLVRPALLADGRAPAPGVGRGEVAEALATGAPPDARVLAEARAALAAFREDYARRMGIGPPGGRAREAGANSASERSASPVPGGRAREAGAPSRGGGGLRGGAVARACCEAALAAREQGRLFDPALLAAVADAEEAAEAGPEAADLRERVLAVASAIVRLRERGGTGGYEGLRFNAGIEAIPDWLPRNFALPEAALAFSAAERRLPARRRPEEGVPIADLAVDVGLLDDPLAPAALRRAALAEGLAFVEDLARHLRLPPPVRGVVRVRRLRRDDPTGEAAARTTCRFGLEALPPPARGAVPAALARFPGGPFPALLLEAPPGPPARVRRGADETWGVRLDAEPLRLGLAPAARLAHRGAPTERARVHLRALFRPAVPGERADDLAGRAAHGEVPRGEAFVDVEVGHSGVVPARIDASGATPLSPPVRGSRARLSALRALLGRLAGRGPLPERG